MNSNDVTIGQRGDGEYVVSIWENDVEAYTGFGQTLPNALRDLADVVEEAVREAKGNTDGKERLESE